MTPSINGRYVYDDDDLTPGKKKEGGLHHNLFDRDGKLKGHARFIPDAEQDDKPDPAKRKGRRKSQTQQRAGEKSDPTVTYETVYEHETVYVNETIYVSEEEYERRQAHEREENERQASERLENAEQIANVVRLLIAVATPHAKRLWHEKARPVIEAQRAKRAAHKARRAATKQPVVVEVTVVDDGPELAVAEEVYRTDMSNAEAQARYLAALAARAFSDEQMKFVSNANIVDGEGLAELQRTLVELPPQQVIGIIEAVEANPTMLSGDLLAELGKLLGLDRAEPEAVPIEVRKD